MFRSYPVNGGGQTVGSGDDGYGNFGGRPGWIEEYVKFIAGRGWVDVSGYFGLGFLGIGGIGWIKGERKMAEL